jgi:hypothetical protein
VAQGCRGWGGAPAWRAGVVGAMAHRNDEGCWSGAAPPARRVDVVWIRLRTKPVRQADVGPSFVVIPGPAAGRNPESVSACGTDQFRMRSCGALRNGGEVWVWRHFGTASGCCMDSPPYEARYAKRTSDHHSWSFRGRPQAGTRNRFRHVGGTNSGCAPAERSGMARRGRAVAGAMSPRQSFQAGTRRSSAQTRRSSPRAWQGARWNG